MYTAGAGALVTGVPHGSRISPTYLPAKMSTPPEQPRNETTVSENRIVLTDEISFIK